MRPKRKGPEEGDRQAPGSTPRDQEGMEPSSRPIEPGGEGSARGARFRWILFTLVALWAVLTAYHEPILSRIGGFLVVSHEVRESDLIVCMAGGAVERCLAAADLYRQGLAPAVFTAREPPPDGYEVLKRAGIHIPESVDIARRILTGSGVPSQSVLVSEDPAVSTMSEAVMVRALAEEKGFRSLIVVTSPTHTRRAWWTFRQVMADDGVRIGVVPSPYSGFRAEDWWKTRRYIKEVIVEYQKLAFYAVSGLFD